MSEQSRSEAPRVVALRGRTDVRKLRPGPGHPTSEVKASQLARLHAAMTGLVDELGYEKVTVRTLTRRAEVSSRTFYEYFKGKQDCLLDTYEDIMRRGARRALAAAEAEDDLYLRLRLALSALAREFAGDPAAARLALVEVSAVGLARLERMEEVRTRFEELLTACLSRGQVVGSDSALVIRAIVSGIARMARVRVLAGREAELPDLVDDVLAWLLCLGDPAAQELAREDGSIVPAVPHGLQTAEEAGRTDDRERELLLSAALALAAREGYWGLSGARISAEAGLSPRSFAAHFESTEACFLACLRLFTDRVLALAEEEAGRGTPWPLGMHRALCALAAYAAAEPQLARLVFIEVFAPGIAGLRQRERLVGNFAERFRASAPDDQRPGEVAADASVGAIAAIVHDYVAGGRAERLPAIAPFLSFLALAPAIGAPSAARLIREDGGRPGADHRHP